MLFGHHVVDKTLEEHLREIGDIANDPQTLIFLDTNILTYLYKLHEAARQEFFQWAEKLKSENRLVIPAWSASEYLNRVATNNLNSYTPKSKDANQASKLLEGLLETASLFVDEASLSRISFPRDRTTFITEFRQAIDALRPFTRVFSQNFEPGSIHQQIETNLSSVILDSDLGTLCTHAAQVGQARFDHRLPPGFRDEDKEHNRYGDLIIWFEILEESKNRKEEFPRVLFISRDEKSDWVYAPQLRKEIVHGTRKSIGNNRPELKLADPRLMAEFRSKVGHSNLTIAGMGHTVEGLSKTNPSLFTHLAAAIQINTEQVEPAASDDSAVPVVETDAETESPVSSAEVLVETEVHHEQQDAIDTADALLEPEAVAAQQNPDLNYDLEALQDRIYRDEAPGIINEIIRDLKSHNWYTQNPAISKIRSLYEQDGIQRESWFVLGRNIYQAACGNSQKAMEYVTALHTQLQRLPDSAGIHVFAGMLFEVYFDANGNFRQQPKFTYADKLLSSVTEEKFSDVLAFITHHLNPHREALRFFPGDLTVHNIRIESHPLELAEQNGAELTKGPSHELRAVVFDGEELLRDIEQQDPSYKWAFISRKTSAVRIKDLISDAMAIPQWALKLEMHPQIDAEAILVLPKDKVFDLD